VSTLLTPSLSSLLSPLLTIHRLHKQFGPRILLAIEDLTIHAASAYVLTGVNGCGKSTLLRILCGLEPAQVGELSFLGQPVRLASMPPAMRRAVVYVHQHPVMFATSVAANIAYGLVARGEPTSVIAPLVDEAMVWAGITHLRHSRCDRLSGGEKQRIALARARILSPKLLLLDEPTANLDGAAREQVIALIPDLVRSGSSVVMACHDRDLIGLPGVQRLKLRDGGITVRNNPVQPD
jgi:tungstate transport system ATP-binding protein